MSVSFQGSLFDGETLTATPVTLLLSDDRLASADGTTVSPVPATAIGVSDRLGDMPRHLYLPDGRTIETPDNQAVDALLVGQRRGRLVALIHALETRSRVAAVATLLLVAGLGVTMWWGLPVLAYRAAMAVPAGIEREAGQTALATINQILAPSDLTSANRKRVTTQVERLVKAGGLQAKPEVIFRSMGGNSPNAFALPGGTIVVSDELVQLASDGELAAVLAHEIGHWQHRHGLQSLLRGSSALLVVSTVTGDLSTLTTFAGTIPFLLLQRGYSREFELEADAYAVELMKKAGIERRHFESILLKLTASRPKQGNDFTYLSTHPGTAERINQIKAASPAGTSATETASTTDDDAMSPSNPNLIAPQPVSRPETPYPADLAGAHVPGRVLIEFIVDLEGKATGARVLSSSRPEFELPVLAAVQQWKFTPGSRHGKKVALKIIQWVEVRPDREVDAPALPATPVSPP